MNRILIKKLIITGSGKQSSEIEFSSGTNIIYGPSNTGKTYVLNCIDYLFGSKENPFSYEHGYNTITVNVEANDGDLSISRKLDEATFSVNSQHPNIKTGKYYRSNQQYEKTINYVWLTLIGIKDKHMILKNELFGRQTLTFRTFIHMFLLNEERMIAKRPVFFSGNTTSVTAELSSFLFLLTGDDYSDLSETDEKKIQEIKQTAIITYIHKEIAQYSSDRSALITKFQEDFADMPNDYIEQKMNKVVTEIADTERNITQALNNNRALLNSIQEVNGKISECELLLNRYTNLLSQYNADLERLSFIVDGTINVSAESNSLCPVCDNEIVSSISPSMVESAKSEYNSISSQIKELKSTIEFVKEEEHRYNDLAFELKQNQNNTNTIINTELKPKMAGLRDQLNIYKNYLHYQNEIDFLKDIAQKKQAEVFEVAAEEEAETVKYKPREKFTSSQISDVSKVIYDLFDRSNFDGLITAMLDVKSMDVIVNGKYKSEYGKGYRAFLNTLYSLSMLLYLDDKGTFSPGYAMYDSPILSLKERDDQPTSSSMKNSLFKLFSGGFTNVQLVIIENELPEIEYSNVNLIHFTKDKENGRYGLLYDVT